MIPYFMRRGGRVADAHGDILRILIKHTKVIAGPPPVHAAAPAGAITAADRDAAIARICARPKHDEMMDDEEWAA